MRISKREGGKARAMLGVQQSAPRLYVPKNRMACSRLQITVTDLGTGKPTTVCLSENELLSIVRVLKYHDDLVDIWDKRLVK